MEKPIKYNCIFGGGGIRGMCYIGAVKALKELDIELEDIAGSSVGAVFAALYAVGYNEEEIKQLFIDFNFNMFRDININIFSTSVSISKGQIFYEWLCEKIEEKIWGEQYIEKKGQKVKFKDLEKNLNILTLDINTNTPYIFSKETTPDEEVAYAVRISASLPGLMQPISQGNAILVDGDLIKSWPAWKIYKNLDSPNTRLLEFRLEGTRDNSEIKNPMDFVNSIINTIWYLSTENVFDLFHNNDRYDYVVIDAKDVILFDFTIDRETKEQLIDKGYKTTKDYFTKTLVEKKKNILTIYEKIYKQLKQLKNFINSKKAANTSVILNEILSTMKEDTKFIDNSVYEHLKMLKELVQSNTKKQFFLSSTLENNEKIQERCTFIENIVKAKIEELCDYINKFCNKC